MKLALSFNAVRDVWSTRTDGFLFVLSRKHHAVGDNQNREYMIVSRLGKHPKGFIVEPVDEARHVLVEHSGFECAGSMCRTDAVVKDVLGAHRSTAAGVKLLNSTITPGRVHGIVRVLDNVNANWSFPIYEQSELDALKARSDFKPDNLRLNTEPGPCLGWYKHGYRTPQPGKCYVEVGDTRACGLPSVEELA